MSNKIFIILFVLLCTCFIVSGKDNIIHKQKCRLFEEYTACGPPCEHTCFDLIEESPCKKEEVCVKGCFCKRGYLRDGYGDCVLPKDCFPESDKIGCKSDEVFDKCNGNCETTCSNYGTHIKCPRKCIPGCLCGEGLVRNEEGNCIPPEFCHKMIPEPKICNSSLEDFHYCFAACEATCNNLDMPLDCSDKCKAGCICKDGLVRDENGNCILPKFCSSTNMNLNDEECIGTHEKFGCELCDTKCATLGSPCPVFSLDCVKKCYCQKGYARDHRNICIPKKKCPRSCNLSMAYFLKFIRY